MNTVTQGEIHKDFEGEKLIPIIFSHGLASNRGMHSGTCKDFASHGYIVFIMDHKDTTSSYWESKSGHESMYYDNK